MFQTQFVENTKNTLFVSDHDFPKIVLFMSYVEN